MRFVADEKTRHAVRHTFHCLIGCGLGEITGMLIASMLGWHRMGRELLAIFLAFCFGYTLTYRGVRGQAKSKREAIRVTIATDTTSIASMEVIDSTMEFLIPNALIVTVASPRFWWGLAVSLLLAFIVTVPVNRYMMGRSEHMNH